MELAPQGQPPVAPATPVTEPATPAVPESLIPFLAEPAAEPAQPPQQGQVQGQPGLPPEQDSARYFQSQYNKTLAEKYALEQRLAAIEAQRFQPQPLQAPPAPDPQTDPAGYVAWKIDRAVESTMEKARTLQQQEMQTMLQQATEMQWANAHPGVDVNAIKMFNRANGIADWNLEVGFRMMNYPQTMANVQQRSTQAALDQFRQVQPGAQPVRQATAGAQPGQGGTVTLNYQKLAEDFARNPAVYETWPPELQKLFNQETNFRRAAQ